ncbi:GNAT family N-acetyltransferase, partial [Klebsiella variicola]|uniref:GNAT family N-acetyltransferase n=1 Tax=Klebsiella variicola TaxID=244366 RepID=UPI00273178C3
PFGTLLHKLYILPDTTGRRYGEQIFRADESRAKADSERWLWLEVLADNPAARSFYERQGVQHVKDVAFHSSSQQSTLHILA